ncbi:hypothetical protein ACFLZM_03460 [Thermodesulfobacteriota bacterium]
MGANGDGHVVMSFLGGTDCRRLAWCGNLLFHWQRERLKCVMSIGIGTAIAERPSQIIHIDPF